MTLGIPGLFPPKGELVNYDYVDYSNGTGYDIYYGFSNAGITGTITESGFYSGMIHKNGAEITLTNQDTYYELLDVDFDITFNIPKDIKGDILIQIPFGINAQTDGTYFIKTTCSVYHYDSTTPTPMGSTTTSEEVRKAISIGEIGSHITTLKVTQATVKHFKKGETLRFTIKVYAQAQIDNERVIGGVGCDPQNRSDVDIDLLANDDTEDQVIETNKPTQIAFHVPFVIPN